jgi:putative flavoprotein involved in K+ transport
METLIVGAGQAGLALSRHLARRGREHVVLERSRIGARWHHESWDSLALLSPNWLNRLPGQPRFAASLEEYASSFSAPVLESTEVERVEPAPDGFRVHTSGGTWTADNVVVATGDCGAPRVPGLARNLPAWIDQLHVREYKRPDLLAGGGVLVVGAGPSGQQVAGELREHGRDVVLAVGRHARSPRRYRGRDIFRWLDATGSLDDTIDDVPEAARRAPSFTLSGARGGADIDLGLLAGEGVVVAGRLVAIEGHHAGFGAELPWNVREADRRMQRMLAQIDAHIAASGEDVPETPVSTLELPAGPSRMNLRNRGIATVIWATGYGRDYGWLDVPGVRTPDGELIQHRGITPAPGLYTLGIRFQHRRSSHFIGGVGRDAAELAEAIAAHSRLAA